MKDKEGNILGEGELVCTSCGLGCRHHTDEQADECIKAHFSGKLDIDDWDEE